MLKRTISGIIFIIIVVTALFAGMIPAALLVLFMSIVSAFELMRASGVRTDGRLISPAEVVTYLAVAAFDIGQIVIPLESIDTYMLSIIAGYFIVILAIYVFTFPKMSANQVSGCALTILYIPLLMTYVFRIRTHTVNGIAAIILLMIVTSGSDMFAYFAGTLLGKHKLAPELSPKKTIEGAVGAVILTAVSAVVFGIVTAKMGIDLGPSLIGYAVLGVVSSIVAQVGDLAASALKRNYGIKDFGNIIPGHGGMMDRLDSYAGTGVVVYLILTYVR